MKGFYRLKGSGRRNSPTEWIVSGKVIFLWGTVGAYQADYLLNAELGNITGYRLQCWDRLKLQLGFADVGLSTRDSILAYFILAVLLNYLLQFL